MRCRSALSWTACTFAWTICFLVITSFLFGAIEPRYAFRSFSSISSPPLNALATASFLVPSSASHVQFYLAMLQGVCDKLVWR